MISYCMLLCDVQLINSYICRPLDLLVAETALEKRRRLGWFLQEAVVPCPHFSDLLATDEREQLAKKLCSCPPSSQPLQPQLPIFPDMTPETKLSDFVGERSYMLFDLLGLSCSWLTLPLAEWDECPDYIQSRAWDCEDNERCS